MPFERSTLDYAVIIMNMVTIKRKNYCKSEEEKLRIARITLRGKNDNMIFFSVYGIYM